MKVAFVLAALAILGLAAAAAPLTGDGGHAGVFSGFREDREWVMLPAQLSADLPRAFTFTAWIKVEEPELGALYKYRNIVSRIDSDNQDNFHTDFQLQVNPDNTLTFFMGGDTGYGILIQTPNALAANTWYHVAFRVKSSGNSATSATVYLNGVSQGFATWASGSTQNYLIDEPINLGYFNNTTTEQYFEGHMDQVRFYSTALTVADINNNMNEGLSGEESNILAEYQFNEQNPNTISDSFGTYDGTGMGGGLDHAISGVSVTSRGWSYAEANAEVTLALAGTSTAAVECAINTWTGDGLVYVNGAALTVGDLGSTYFPANSMVRFESSFLWVGVANLGYQCRETTDTVTTTSTLRFSFVDCSANNVGTCFAEDEDCLGVEGGSAVEDECGECNGNGSSCICVSGVFDICGVCDGDGSSCGFCQSYQGYDASSLNELLLEFSIDRSLATIDDTITALWEAAMALESFDLEVADGDLGPFVEQLNQAIKSCIPTFNNVVASYGI